MAGRAQVTTNSRTPEADANIPEGFRGSPTAQPSWVMKEAAPDISCRNCYFHNWERPGTCQAYPQGIPDEIAYGQVVHAFPYPGDNGIIFTHWTKSLDEEDWVPSVDGD